MGQARIRDTQNAYIIVVGKPSGKRSLERRTRRLSEY
jgi:hypothetical protein